MATKYVIQVDVNAQGAITNADEVAKKLEQANTAAGSAAGGMNALRKELKAVESELAGLDPNSAKFAEISNRAGEIKDRMKDIKEAVGNQAGPAVEVFGNNLGKLKGDLANLDFEGATSAIRGMGSAVKGFSFKDLIGGIKNFGSALANVGKALLTNPIFLIAAAVAAAALAINAAFESIQAEQQKTIDLAYENANAEKEKLQALSDGENTLKLQGKSEKEILKLKIDQVNAAIQAQETAIETQKAVTQQQIEQAKRNKEIVSGILQFITIPLQALLFGVDQLTEKLNAAGIISDETFKSIGNLRDKFNDKVSSLLFDPDQMQKDADASIKEQEKTLKALQNQRDGFLLTQRANSEKALREQEDALLAIEKGSYKARLIELDRFYSDLRQKANGNKELLKKIAKQEADELAVLNGQKETNEKNTQEHIGAIQSIGIQSQGIVLSQGLQAREATIQQSNSNITQLTEEELAKQQARDAEIMQMRIDTVNNGLSTIANLSTLFAGKSEKSQRRAFEIQKKVQIAAALVDTYKSATAAYASQIIPGDPSSPVRGAIAAAAAITAGLVNVNNIRKQQFGGGGGSAAGGGSAPSAGGGGGSAPAFSVTNNTDVGERPAQQAIKTYVLASDVTNNQEATEKIESRTRIG